MISFDYVEQMLYRRISFKQSDTLASFQSS